VRPGSRSNFPLFISQEIEGILHGSILILVKFLEHVFQLVFVGIKNGGQEHIGKKVDCDDHEKTEEEEDHAVLFICQEKYIGAIRSREQDVKTGYGRGPAAEECLALLAVSSKYDKPEPTEDQDCQQQRQEDIQDFWNAKNDPVGSFPDFLRLRQEDHGPNKARHSETVPPHETWFIENGDSAIQQANNNTYSPNDVPCSNLMCITKGLFAQPQVIDHVNPQEDCHCICPESR